MARTVWAAVGAMLFVGGCKKDVPFTRVPDLGVSEAALAAQDVPVLMDVPLDLQPGLAAVDTAFGATPIRFKTSVDNLACERRRQPWLECMGAAVTLELVREGSIAIGSAGGRLEVRLPLRYDISARGYGWARAHAERKTGLVTAVWRRAIGLEPTWQLALIGADTFSLSEPSVRVLQGEVPLARLAEPLLRQRLAEMIAALRLHMPTEALKTAVLRGWQRLHAPLRLSMRGDGWLRSAPAQVAGVDLVERSGTLAYRVAVITRLVPHTGQRPAATPVSALPAPQRPTGTTPDWSGPIQLTLPLEVPVQGLQAALQAAFPAGDVLTTRADLRTDPLDVRVSAAALMPARDRLAIELQLDIVEPRRLRGLTGKAYLTARPLIDPEQQVLELTDIGFPKVPPREPKPVPGPIRIGEEPFAGRLARMGQLDLAPVLSELLPRVNASLSQPLGGDVVLSGAFETWSVAATVPTRDGVRLDVTLTGRLALMPAGPITGALPERRTP